MDSSFLCQSPEPFGPLVPDVYASRLEKMLIA
jgi:hypothetical protein